jgi:hypothetical protein
LLDKGPGSDWWLRSGLAKHVCNKLHIEWWAILLQRLVCLAAWWALGPDGNASMPNV